MNKNIQIFTKNGCIQCKMTKRFLNENNVIFEEHNISENPEAVSFLKDQGFQSVPVVFADQKQPVVGFNPDELRKLAL